MSAHPSRRPDPPPDLPPGTSVRQAIAALNDALARRGTTLRVSQQVELPAQRDALSVRLVEVLRETRERRALELLYRLNAPLLEEFVRHRLRDVVELDAADVVDEAFLRVFTRCETFRATAGATFAGWVMVIADNIIRQQRRSTRRSGRVPWPDDDRVPADLAEPSAPLEAEELRALVAESWPTIVQLCAAGLLRLPPRWRRVLELREGDGLTYREIAARLGLRTGHVAMLLHRARARVVRYLVGTLAPYRPDRPDQSHQPHQPHRPDQEDER